MTARNVELEASAVNTDSMLADQAARFNEEIEALRQDGSRLTAERDALKVKADKWQALAYQARKELAIIQGKKHDL